MSSGILSIIILTLLSDEGSFCAWHFCFPVSFPDLTSILSLIKHFHTIKKTLLLLLAQIVYPFTLRQVSLRREIWFSSSSARYQLKAVDIHSLVEATKQALPLHGCCPHHHKSWLFNLLIKHFALIQYSTVSFITFCAGTVLNSWHNFPRHRWTCLEPRQCASGHHLGVISQKIARREEGRETYSNVLKSG